MKAWRRETNSIYGHRFVFPIRDQNQYFEALKAPTETSPGQRPGFWIESISVRPEGAQGVLPPLQGGRLHRGTKPGALPRAGILRAVGATTWLSFLLGKKLQSGL